jgi:hypothetical protein
MDKNELSSRKITTRLPSRDGSSSTQGITSGIKSTNQSTSVKENLHLTSIGDNFFRKSGKSFNPSSSFQRTDNYGILKSDLFQLQEMINENAYLTKMYKITSKSSNFTKKLTEIEDNKDIKFLIDKITEDASNIDRIGKIYNSNNTTELIQKLSLDVYYLDLILRKINEYFLVLQLKVGGDENLYQESHSKFNVIKLVIEKLLKKTYTADNCSNGEDSQNLNFVSNVSNTININSSVSINEKIGECSCSKLNDVESLPEFIKLYKKSENKPLYHLAKLSSDFIDKLSSNYDELIQKYSLSATSFNNNLQLDGFITQKLLIEKLINEKQKDFENMKSKFNELTVKHTNSEEKLKTLDEELIRLNKLLDEKKNNIIRNEKVKKIEESDSNTQSSLVTGNNSVESLKIIIEESKKYF